MRLRRLAATALSAAVTCSGCDSSPPANAPSASAAPTASVQVDASAAPTASVQVDASAAPADKHSVELEATVVAEPEVGRPGPGVLPVTADPRFTLPVRIESVDPAAPDLPVGKQLVLGIHSPSRMFRGGVSKGTRVRLRLHWRPSDGGRHYDHAEQIRGPQ